MKHKTTILKSFAALALLFPYAAVTNTQQKEVKPTWLTKKITESIRALPEKIRLSRLKYEASGKKKKDIEAEEAKSYALVKRDFELWYKGSKSGNLMGLPTFYFAFFSYSSLVPGQKLISSSTNWHTLKAGDRHDKLFLRKDWPTLTSLILLTDKQKPADSDLIYFFIFDDTEQDLLLRFRVLDAKEKGEIRFGPIDNKWYMFGPQTGPSFLRSTGKTESGKPLQNNIKANQIISGKITWGALKNMDFPALLEYVQNLKHS